LPMPSSDTSFEDILKLRESELFQGSLASLREWMSTEVLPRPGEAPDITVKRAVGRLDKMAEQYRDALSRAKYAKVTGAITSVLAIGAVVAALSDPALKILAGVATPFFSFRTLFRPSWKDLQTDKTFPAAAICEAEVLQSH
ncbi:MAG: hypothetical protein ABI625_22915, partial [bacterium]